MQKQKKQLTKRQVRKYEAKRLLREGCGPGFEPLLGRTHPAGNRAERQALVCKKRGKGGVNWRQKKQKRGEHFGLQRERRIRERTSRDDGDEDGRTGRDDGDDGTEG